MKNWECEANMINLLRGMQSSSPSEFRSMHRGAAEIHFFEKIDLRAVSWCKSPLIKFMHMSASGQKQTIFTGVFIS